VKVYLRTFGCRANHYDTEAVRAMVTAAGHEVVHGVADADVAVFNSCAVTSEAEAELRKAVRRAAKDRPALRSIVMGCASALDDQRPVQLRARSLPSVEQIVAGADLEAVATAFNRIARHPDASRSEAEGPLCAEQESSAVFMVLANRTQTQSTTRAVLRIQDGCDEHCTFCATTLARGANRSRPIDALVDEARVLAERHPEIVLTGIHIGTFGRDIGTSLGTLVERLVTEVPTVRFRLSSIEATELDDRLVELLVGEPSRLAPYVHAPLQSGSDRVLKRMGRHWYTSATYARALETLAARMSVLGLGADVITGFPGETDDDHALTRALIERLPFTYLHVFPFSMRPGTAAERLGAPVAASVANARAAELRALATTKGEVYAGSRVGGEADVVVIGDGGKKHGLTGDFLQVDLAGSPRPRGDRFAARLGVGSRGLTTASS
jgi:threonylcarbamoyladenosine tRNA methylthiotransferase MtaB